MLNRGYLHQFAFIYADRHRDLLKRLEDTQNIYSFLDNQGLVWQLATFAQSKGLPRRSFLISQAEVPLNNILYPLIVDYLYGQKEAWRVRCYSDSMVKQASELFSQGIYSPLALPSPTTTLIEMSDSTDGEEGDSDDN